MVRRDGWPCSAERTYPSLSYRAAELLVSIPHQKLFAVPSGPFDATTAPFASTPARPKMVPIADTEPNIPPHRHAPKLQRIPDHVRLRELELEMREGDFLATAQKCFEHREFKRAVYWLHECRSAKALFLSVYSQYMVLYDLVFRPLRLDLIGRELIGGRETSAEGVEQIFKYASGGFNEPISNPVDRFPEADRHPNGEGLVTSIRDGEGHD